MKEKGIFAASLFVLLVYSAVFTFSNPSITASIVAEKNMVSLTSSGFEPAEITITQGESVTWVNKNTFTLVWFSSSSYERFTTHEVKPNTTYTHIFTHAGTFSYWTTQYGFKGTVIVKAGEEEPEDEPLPCADGCISDDSGCSCPCYTDEDCDDGDNCTIDICQSTPVKCMQTIIANCSNAMTPVVVPRQDNSSIFIGGFLALTAIILAFVAMRLAKPAKT